VLFANPLSFHWLFLRNGVCQCKAFKLGKPCKRRAAAQLVTRNNEAVALAAPADDMTGRANLIAARKAAAIGNPLVLMFARLRGLLDAMSLAFRLLFRGGGFAQDYVEQIETIART
jgi:hypothetical protein